MEGMDDTGLIWYRSAASAGTVMRVAEVEMTRIDSLIGTQVGRQEESVRRQSLSDGKGVVF